MRVVEQQRAHRILVLNAKGGCGKTTIATNLACQYACEKQPTALIDYDPQASSTHWLDARPKGLPPIHCIKAGNKNGITTRTWQLRVPVGTTRIIVDTPARLEAMTAAKLIREADTILIPVMASSIDIRAATQFLAELTKYPEFRNSKKRIAIVGNRVRKNTNAYRNLKAFLEDLDIPFISSLRDTQNYVRAAEEGVGIQELKLKSAKIESAQWSSLVRWIDGERGVELA